MKAIDFFRAFLRDYLKGQPRGTQSKIADEVGIDRKLISDYVRGRKPLSETKRESIAEYLGVNYEETIAVGRRFSFDTDVVMNILKSQKDADTLRHEIKSKLSDLNEEDLKIINDLATRLSKK